MSHLCDMSARADIFESITPCYVGVIFDPHQGTKLGSSLLEGLRIPKAEPLVAPTAGVAVKLHSDGQNAISPYLFYAGDNLTYPCYVDIKF